MPKILAYFGQEASGNRAEHVHKKAFRRYVDASTALAVAAAATGVSAGVKVCGGPLAKERRAIECVADGNGMPH